MQFSTRSAKDYVVLLGKGMAMGAADVVPGVSGGTIAFISGIYDELLHSLQQCNPAALLVWKNQGTKAFWRHINGNFLVCLFAGVLISLKTFAQLITVALASYPIVVWGFFFGLVLASIVYLGRQQRGFRWPEWLGLVLGALAVYGVSLARPAQLPAEPWVLFGGGFIAICAMILPGISGSFLLLLLGLYPAFLAAINEFNLVALASFGAGCICGLLLFARVLAWLLDRHHKVTMAVLIGFLIGSLNVIWPWKITVESIVNRHGETVPVVQETVLPWQFQALTGAEPFFWPALTAAFLGIFIVLSTEYVGGRHRREN